MKRLAFGLLLLASVAIAPAQPVVFIVRHAEKATTGGNDPDLSQAGQARADILARMLKDSGIVSIFTSEAKRTKETAAPTAKSLSITPTVVPGKDVPALVSKLRELKGNALVVGHGNTIPEILKALGINTPVQIDENDYGQMFVVVLGDKPQLLRLRYPMWASFS